MAFSTFSRFTKYRKITKSFFYLFCSAKTALQTATSPVFLSLPLAPQSGGRDDAINFAGHQNEIQRAKNCSSRYHGR